MKKLRNAVALIMTFTMALSVTPIGAITPLGVKEVRAEGTVDPTVPVSQAAVSGEQGSEMDTEVTEVADHQQEILDEAVSLGVPDAFMRRNFADKYDASELESPVTELGEEEEDPEISTKNMKVVTATSGNTGLQVKGVDTGILARTKFDLGEFDFGDLKPGNLVYNMLAKRNLKGKAYLYFGDSEKEFATISIKRCADDDWEATKNKVVDVRGAGLTGKGHIYLKFVADSALDEEGIVIPTSGVKGNLYFESMFFTEGSTPVLDFDLDNEVNTIENINGSEKHTIMRYGNMNVKIPDGYVAEYTDKTLKDETYELEYIRGRGNSTWLVDKKPYKIKLDKSSDLFGMGKNKHWVLLANYYDYSLLRNKMTFYLADKLGMEFTPKSVSVDVIISGEYYGSYQLSQQVRVGKANVNIDDLEDDQATEEPNITGGYILAMGSSWLKEEEESGEQCFDSAAGTFKIERPEYDSDYSESAKEAQKAYLTNYFNELEALVRATDEEYDPLDDTGLDSEYTLIPPEGKTWRDYLDEKSFIDHYLLQEFSKNGDFGSGSTYLYKKRNGKLYWGPVWDFDFVAWGAYATNYTVDGALEKFSLVDTCPWFGTLIRNDAAFKEKVIERWKVLSDILKGVAEEGGYLDQCKEKLYYSALANYQVRGSYLMQSDGYWGDDIELVDDEGNPYTLNYGNEVERLKNYIKIGALWMDENISKIDEFSSFDDYPAVPFLVDGEVVAEVSFDGRKGCLKVDEIPEPPEKEGYILKGWYYVDEDGVECKLHDYSYPYYYDMEKDETLSCDVYAKYIPIEEYQTVKTLTFARDTVYVPMYTEYDEYDDSEYTSSQSVDMRKFLNYTPFGADVDDLEWSLDADVELLTYIDVSDTGELSVNTCGEFYVVCKNSEQEARVKVVAFDGAMVADPMDTNIGETLTLKKGEYGDINFSFDVSENVSFESYNNVYIKSSNEDVVQVNGNGLVYAKGAGTADIYVVWTGDSGVDIKATKVTVTGDDKKTDASTDKTKTNTQNTGTVANTGTKAATGTKSGGTTTSETPKKPVKAVISKIYTKKKSAKKLKLKLKKLADAKGYQIAVYRTKKNAQKTKKAIVSKNVKKVTATISSKKLKNKKTLYVRVRAYNTNGKQKIYGAWSKVKEVTIK